MSCAFKDFGFKGKENILVIGNMEVGERAAVNFNDRLSVDKKTKP